MAEKMNWDNFTIQTHLAWRRTIQPYLIHPQKKKYTMLSLTAISLIVFGIFTIKPALTTIANLRKRIKDYQQTYEAMEEKIEKITRARQVYLEAKDDLTPLEKAIPSEKPLSSLLNTLEAAANQTGVQIATLNLEKETKLVEGSRIEIIPFNIKVSGSLEQILTLLEKLQTADRVITVEAVSLSFSNDPSENDRVIANLKLEAYYYLR